MAGAIELAPDMKIGVAEILAMGQRALVGRTVARGHLANGGGEAEIEIVNVSLDDEG